MERTWNSRCHVSPVNWEGFKQSVEVVGNMIIEEDLEFWQLGFEALSFELKLHSFYEGPDTNKGVGSNWTSKVCNFKYWCDGGGIGIFMNCELFSDAISYQDLCFIKLLSLPSKSVVICSSWHFKREKKLYIKSLLEYKQLASLVLVGETDINLVLGIPLVAVEAIATVHCKGVCHILILKLDSTSMLVLKSLYPNSYKGCFIFMYVL